MGLNRNLGQLTEVIKENDGKIGIGNSIPSEILDVTGNIKATSFIKLNGTDSEYLMADGSVSTGPSLSNYLPLTGGTLSGQLTATSISFPQPSIIALANFSGYGAIQLSDSSNYTLQAGSALGGMEFIVGGSQKMLILNNGNTGIGSSNPIRKLEVASDGSNWISGTFSGTGGTDKVVIGNLAGATIGSHNAALNAWSDFTIAGTDIKFSPYGAEAMRVTASGNVGIGTISPTSKLHVVGSAFFSSYVDLTGFVTTGNNFMSSSGGIFFKGYNNFETGILTANSGNDFLIQTGSSERMRINSGGNVGIGTTSPTFKLDILSSGANTRINSADANGSYLVFANNGTAKAYIGSAYHLFGSPYNVANDLGLRSDAAMSFSTGGTPVRMHITSGGNVGIGTASPSAKLHLYLADGVNDNTLRIQQGTNAYASGINLVANNDGGAVYNFINSQTNGGTEHWRIGGGATNSTMAISTGGTERMRVTSNGELLIGRTSSYSAGWQLAVEGNIYAKYDIRADGGASFGGNLLIGTTTDTGQKMQVAGLTNIYSNNSSFQQSTNTAASGSNVTFNMGSNYGQGTGGDNIAGLVIISVNEASTNIANGNAVYVGSIINPRGSGSVLTQISKVQGAGVTSFSVVAGSGGGNAITVNATLSSGATYRANLTFIGGGGIS